ncbi:hypothetical protein AVEN_147610-1 [Araneus ventricosus]|uniref:Uncharacterized protein n=1 Tax=Araneus ventricosus TaxID=182803 RepID=A0A4Y2H1W1_ARAVE|nr:hypothetical protein AVEN_147610-1 [Araneus ventricosus]
MFRPWPAWRGNAIVGAIDEHVSAMYQDSPDIEERQFYIVGTMKKTTKARHDEIGAHVRICPTSQHIKVRSIGTAFPYRILHLQLGLTDNPPQNLESGPGPARPTSFLLLSFKAKTSLSPTTNKIPVTPTKGPHYAASNLSLFPRNGTLCQGNNHPRREGE